MITRFANRLNRKIFKTCIVREYPECYRVDVVNFGRCCYTLTFYKTAGSVSCDLVEANDHLLMTVEAMQKLVKERKILSVVGTLRTNESRKIKGYEKPFLKKGFTTSGFSNGFTFMYKQSEN